MRGLITQFIYAQSPYSMRGLITQFIYAQSPYSMRGLITGFAYGYFGFSYIITYLIMLPITYTVHKWPPNRYGCGTWHLLSASVILLLIFILACILGRMYKKRQRGDILPNEHIAICYQLLHMLHNVQCSGVINYTTACSFHSLPIFIT